MNKTRAHRRSGRSAPAARDGARHQRRAGFLGALLALALLVGTALAGQVLVRTIADITGQASTGIDDAVLVVALAVFALALLWLAVLTLASSAALARARSPILRAERVLDRLAPRTTARISALLLAATALGSLSSTSNALAAPTSASLPAAGSATGATPGLALPTPDFAPSGTEAAAPVDCHRTEGAPLPVPGWTPGSPRLQAGSSTDRVGLLGGCRLGPDGDGRPEPVVVLRGDTLWSIVQAHLGPHATAEQIAQAWPAWYAHNRAAIGSDPDLLHPGATLFAPIQEPSR